jgi:hypothetical protein
MDVVRNSLFQPSERSMASELLKVANEAVNAPYVAQEARRVEDSLAGELKPKIRNMNVAKTTPKNTASGSRKIFNTSQ